MGVCKTISATTKCPTETQNAPTKTVHSNFKIVHSTNPLSYIAAACYFYTLRIGETCQHGNLNKNTMEKTNNSKLKFPLNKLG